MITTDPAGFANVRDDAVYFVPVRASMAAGADDAEFRAHVHDLALDCVNQGGADRTLVIAPS